MTVKRIGFVYTGAPLPRGRHLRPMSFNKKLAFKDLMISVLTAAWLVAIAFTDFDPGRWFWFFLALAWSGISVLKGIKYSEEKR